MAQAPIGELRVLRGLDSAQYSDCLKNARGQLKNVGKSMQLVGRNMSAYVTAPIAGFGALTLKAAGDFEQAMRQVKAVSSATGEEFEALREQAKELGARSEEHTSELQSRGHLVCRLLLEKKQRRASRTGSDPRADGT